MFLRSFLCWPSSYIPQKIVRVSHIGKYASSEPHWVRWVRGVQAISWRHDWIVERQMWSVWRVLVPVYNCTMHMCTCTCAIVHLADGFPHDPTLAFANTPTSFTNSNNRRGTKRLRLSHGWAHCAEVGEGENSANANVGRRRALMIRVARNFTEIRALHIKGTFLSEQLCNQVFWILDVKKKPPTSRQHYWLYEFMA